MEEKTKICSCCKEEKPFENFYRDKLNTDGFKSKCKNCTKLLNNKYRFDNHEKVKQNQMLWYEKNREKIVRYRKNRRNIYSQDFEIKNKVCSCCELEKLIEEFSADKFKKDGFSSRCKRCTKLLVDKYRKNNPEKYNSYRKKYAENNPEKLKQWDKNKYNKNADKIKERSLKYYKENKEDYRVLFNRRATTKGRLEVKNLEDRYIKSLIRSSTNLKNIPKDLKEIKRMQIKVKRELKNKKDENTETC